ncbi:MAG: MFS transporter [Clostridia bacterium]|nr:MFS transporter [Clostridia bacterium]
MGKLRSRCTQKTVIWLCWLVYAIAYLGRYSYNANISMIMDDYNISHATAGLVTTCFFFAYGIGQVINGFMCKKYNKTYLFPLVLISAAIINLLTFVVPFSFFKYMWLLNGILQSCLWPSIINVLSDNIESKNMESALFIMGITATAGTVFAYGSSAFFAWIGNYRYMFVFAAVAMILIGVLWFLLFNNKPINIEKETLKNEDKTKFHISAVGALFIAMALFAVVDNLVKDGINTWVPAILTEKYSMKDELSILSTIVLPILGMLGATISVELNKYIKNFVSLTTLFFAASTICILLIITLGSLGPLFMLVCFGIVMCMMHAVNNIITSIVPLKMRGSINPGKAAGILNGFCYLGSTISSSGLGLIADIGGWEMVFKSLFVLSVACTVFGALFAVRKRVN